MSDGWKPLEKPKRPKVKAAGREAFIVSPFTRLARVHALSAAGDAMITVALAGSLFFSIDPSAARWRVGLYLAFTMAPFALVSPLIGPAIDRARGGRRMMVVVLNLLRAIFALLMMGNLDSLLLFPSAFGLLVFQKGYAVAKAAIVPTVVNSSEELVEKNARLALLSGVAGFAGAAPAGLAQLVAGGSLAVGLAMVTFFGAFLLSFKLPVTQVVTDETEAADETEKAELRSSPILLAASGMGIMRGIIGFFTFLVAFAYRGGTDGVDLTPIGKRAGAEVWSNVLGRSLDAQGVGAIKLGLVIAGSVLGGTISSLTAAKIRAAVGEQRMLAGAMSLVSAVALLGAWAGGLSSAILVAIAVGLGVSAGKLAFDSIVQRNAPDANYGRSFARFETRFQITWVLGALIPVVLTIPARLGFLIISAAAGSAAISYILGLRAADIEPVPLGTTDPPVPQPLGPAPTPDPTLVRAPDPAREPTLPVDVDPDSISQLPLWDESR